VTEPAKHSRRSAVVVPSRGEPRSGIAVGEQLRPDLGQQRALRKAHSTYERGASLRQIAATLEAMKVRPNNGATSWHSQTVKCILTSTMALGRRTNQRP
jgi:hypothetical protein